MRLGSFGILARSSHSRPQSLPYASFVAERIHRLHGCRCGAARCRGFMEKFSQRSLAFAPGENPVGEGVVAVAAGKGCSENVELALRNFEYTADLLEDVFNLAPRGARESWVESQSRESAPAAAHRTGH